VNAFQERPDPGVFLLRPPRRGHGLKLTTASYVVLYDPWLESRRRGAGHDRSLASATQPSMAYRLDRARHGLGEEKNLELQPGASQTRFADVSARRLCAAAVEATWIILFAEE